MRIIVYSVFVRAIVCIGICSVQRRFSPMDLSCTRYFLPFFFFFCSSYSLVLLFLLWLHSGWWCSAIGKRQTEGTRFIFVRRFLLASLIHSLSRRYSSFLHRHVFAAFQFHFSSLHLVVFFIVVFSSCSTPSKPLFRSLFERKFSSILWDFCVRVSCSHRACFFIVSTPSSCFSSLLRSPDTMSRVAKWFLFLSWAFVFIAFISCIEIRLLSRYIDLQWAYTHTNRPLSKRKQRACQKQNDVIIIIKWRAEIGGALGRNLQ